MRQVTGNMGQVVRGMDKAMETMNLERVSRDEAGTSDGEGERSENQSLERGEHQSNEARRRRRQGILAERSETPCAASQKPPRPSQDGRASRASAAG